MNSLKINDIVKLNCGTSFRDKYFRILEIHENEKKSKIIGIYNVISTSFIENIYIIKMNDCPEYLLKK